MHIKIVIFLFLSSLYIYPSYAEDLTLKFKEANDLILLDNYSGAKKLLEKLLSKNPKNKYILNNLAYIEAKTGNINNAVIILRNAIGNDEEVEIIYKNLTNLYAFQANILYEEALSMKESGSREINLTLVKNIVVTSNEIPVLKNILKPAVTDNLSKINPNDAIKFLNEWASFWQNKSFQEYFNCYADSFYPKKFNSKDSWVADRRNKIENKKNISIKISNIKIISFGENNFLAQFTQSYDSDSFSDVVNKHTTVIFENNSFKITGEYILK